jgi:hypothetical protein
VAVKQNHSWTITAMPNADRDLANLDVIQREALEHEQSLPRRRPG